jgi:DNA-binding NarL/FixJ family response regulator
MKIKICLAEDNPVTRKNYQEIFSFYKEIEIVLIAENGQDLIEKLSLLPEAKMPDIILMDFEMPVMNGIEALTVIKDKYPGIEVIMLTVFKEDEQIFKSINAGASGYLLKDASIDELIRAIKDVKSGGVPLSKSIARKVLGLLRKEEIKQTPEEKFNLTKREIEVLQSIVNDATEYAIATDLNISEHTVRSHVKNIYKKLRVHSRGAVVKTAIKENLLNNK